MGRASVNNGNHQTCSFYTIMNTIETIIQTITFILAPVVMVSCCTLFLNAMLTRYNNLSDRMRNLHQERFNLLLSIDSSITGALRAIEGLNAVRIREIEEQLPHLLKRHRQLHLVAMFLYLAIATFVISMFIIAISTLTSSPAIAISALVIFLLGTALILTGIIIALLEFYSSNRAVHYEVLHGLNMGREDNKEIQLSEEEVHLLHLLNEKFMRRARKMLDWNTTTTPQQIERDRQNDL